MKSLIRLAPHRWQDLLSALAVAVFVLALYYPLLFTNRVLATGDILLYFYPYRDFAAAAVREGRIPLWNPYLFLGAPFLANPQAAVLYPLHWPLSWLPVTKQIYWSAAIHTWLLGFGGYLLVRRWGVRFGAALISGLVLAGSGFYGGLLGHLNQMNGAAWLPWATLILAGWPYPAAAPLSLVRRRWSFMPDPLPVLTFGLVAAFMVLAGHTQTAYINLFGLGVWAFWQALPRRQEGRYRWDGIQLSPILTLATGGLLGALLSGAQLLPTLEVSRLGLRSSGLSYAEATSFSLKPLHLLWTLLPSYGLADLESVFDTPAYSEFVAYVGLAGLALAVVGAWRGRGAPRTFGLIFTGLGLLLALGRWNPLYFLLYLSVPGFDLFRTPARWMMLYTFGMAVLAGVGGAWGIGEIGRRWGRLGGFDGATASNPPNLPHLLNLLPPTLVLIVAVDLLLAARALPHTQPTAPQAVYDVRTAPAHLLTDPVRAEVGPAAMGRFLGISTITYDPGDMGDWRRILREETPVQLSEGAFADFIIALKVQELLAPNLPLLWRIPAVDGFDGGVLPLQRYNEFLTLFIPPAELVPDGRLREQVSSAPATRLLNLVNGQYLITDKVRDLWFEGIFYDRQIGAHLRPGLGTVVVEAPQPFEATHLDLIGFVDGPPSELVRLADQNQAVATVSIVNNTTINFTLVAGGEPGADLSDGRLDSPLASSSGAIVAYRNIEGGRQEYRVRLALPEPVSPSQITIQRLDTPLDVVVQAMTLFDERTGMFAPLLPSDRGRFRLVHSGDVKIYENLDLLPRAYLVHEVIGADDSADALAVLQNGQIDPATVAVVEGLNSFATASAPSDRATIVRYEPEWVEISTETVAGALLVLNDTAFPGWQATVDGAPAPIHVTNYLGRGVVVPPGEHTVVFVYQPTSWQYGLWLSGGGVVITLGLALWAWLRSRREISRLPSPLL